MRKYNPGDRIKVRRFFEGKTSWHQAIYLSRIVTPCARPHRVVQGNDPDIVKQENVPLTMVSRFSDEDVLPYNPISHEKVLENGIKHAENIKRYVTEAMGKLLLPEHRATVEVHVEDGIVNIADGSLTITPEAIESQTMLGFTERAGWTIESWYVVNNYPHSPDDVMDRPEGETCNPFEAASIAVRAWWNRFARSYWEDITVTEWIGQDPEDG